MIDTAPVRISSFFLFVAIATQTACGLSRLPAPPSSEPIVSSANTPLRSEPARVVDYTLKASLDEETHTIHGDGTIVWRNTSSVAVSEVWVHLYLNAFKNESSQFLRPGARGRGNGVTAPSHTWGAIDVRRFALREPGGSVDLWPRAELSRPNDTDESDARVALPRPVEPNESITIDMVWDSKLPAIVERTGFDGSYNFAGQWFPKLARLDPDGTWAHFPFFPLSEFYADFGHFDVTIDVDQKATIGATGTRLDARVENGRRIERYEQSHVHDFAWVSWDKFVATDEQIGKVRVRVLAPRGFGHLVERELATLRFALPHYGALYGEYPYDVLTVVHPPPSAGESGGMEYPTLITTGGSWHTPSSFHSIEGVTIHEFGHQYFYGLLASNEHKWPFLDEGLNSYAEGEALHRWLGNGSLVGLGPLQIDFASVFALSTRTAVFNEPVATSAGAFQTGSDYGTLVYARTAAIFETLRRVYGDALVAAALGDYARRFRFLHPTPVDFFAVLGGHYPPETIATLHTALFEKGWVDFAITDTSSHKQREPFGMFDRNGTRVTVGADAGPADPQSEAHTGWVNVVRRGTLSFPVTIRLTFDDTSAQDIAWDGRDDHTRLAFNSTSPLAFAVVDPDGRVIIDQDFTNNRAANSGHRGSARRSSEALFYAFQLALSVVGP